MRLEAGAPGRGNLAGEVRQGPGMQRTWGDWHQPGPQADLHPWAILGPGDCHPSGGRTSIPGCPELGVMGSTSEVEFGEPGLCFIPGQVPGMAWGRHQGLEAVWGPGRGKWGMGRREVCAPRPHQRTPGLVALPCSTVAADRATSSPA